MILTYFTNLLQVSRPPTPSSNEWKCTNGPWSPCRLKACSYNHPEVTCAVDWTFNPIISCWHTVLSMPDMTDKSHTTLPMNMEVLSMPEMTDKSHTALPHIQLYLWTWGRLHAIDDRWFRHYSICEHGGTAHARDVRQITHYFTCEHGDTVHARDVRQITHYSTFEHGDTVHARDVRQITHYSTCEHGGVGIGQIQHFLPDGGHFLGKKQSIQPTSLSPPGLNQQLIQVLSLKRLADAQPTHTQHGQIKLFHSPLRLSVTLWVTFTDL